MLNVYYCVLFSSRFRVRIRVRIRFRIWLVSCYAHVFVLFSIVTEREFSLNSTNKIACWEIV